MKKTNKYSMLFSSFKGSKNSQQDDLDFLRSVIKECENSKVLDWYSAGSLDQYLIDSNYNEPKDFVVCNHSTALEVFFNFFVERVISYDFELHACYAPHRDYWLRIGNDFRTRYIELDKDVITEHIKSIPFGELGRNDYNKHQEKIQGMLNVLERYSTLSFIKLV